MSELVYHWVNPVSVGEIPLDAQTVDIYRDRWWIMNEKGEIAFYQGRTMPRHGAKYTMPQCNPNKVISDTILKNFGEGYSVGFVPVVYIPHHCSDYQ